MTSIMSNTEQSKHFGRRKKGKTIKEKLRSLTYMQVSLTLFVVSLLALVFCLWYAISSNGMSGTLVALVGILAFFAALAGLLVTLYGHFAVGIEGKLHWIAGAFTNGTLLVITFLLYLSGLGG
ncbi:hypothetical protein [Hominifimenecus sp. rT4P-3]|uniref:hypothetical protein n=1 Tax=Hominifimenecus sp. rT4P-3 TaxID=3242979 RepID=UPI003DA5D2F3